MLKLITYNIKNGRKLDLIAQWIASDAVEFDIFCMQEFPKHALKEFIKKIHLTHYKYKFAPSFMDRKKREYGELTLFSTDKLTLIKSSVVLLGSSFLEKRLIRNKGNRSSLITLFSYKGKKFILSNSHLICYALNKRRKNQLQKTLDAVDKIVQPNTIPTVVLGDFNYTSLIRQRGLMEFMQSRRFTNAYNKSTHRLFLVKQQLDYIFYKQCKISDVFVKRLPYSDHAFIRSTLSL